MSLAFLLFLGGVGILMLAESERAYLRRGVGQPRRAGRHHYAMHGLPLKVRFPRSQLYISALPPLGLGFAVGVLAAIMGVGGGLFLIPAMIYLLGMPTVVVVGTSLLQILFVAASVTILHAATGHTVDVVLALILLTGAVLGTQLGIAAGAKLPGESLRILLAVLLLAVAARVGVDLIATPQELFAVARVQ